MLGDCLAIRQFCFFIIMEIAGKSIKDYIQNLHHVARAYIPLNNIIAQGYVAEFTDFAGILSTYQCLFHRLLFAA